MATAKDIIRRDVIASIPVASSVYAGCLFYATDEGRWYRCKDDGSSWEVTTSEIAAQAANTVLAGPTTGSDAAPDFRALVTDDLADNLVTTPKINDGAVTAAKASTGTATDLANSNGAGS